MTTIKDPEKFRELIGLLDKAKDVANEALDIPDENIRDETDIYAKIQDWENAIMEVE